MFLHVHSINSDQTGQIPRLIQVITGCTCHFVGFVILRLDFDMKDDQFLFGFVYYCQTVT